MSCISHPLGFQVSSVAVFGGALAASIACMAEASAPVVATATYSLNGGPATSINITGTPTPSGNFSFVKTITTTEHKITFNYAGDTNPANNALINGSTTVENLGTAPMLVATTFAAPICPHLYGSSNIGGLCTVKLICNGDGGAVTCNGEDDFLVSAMIDGTAAQALFFCPFFMAKTGAGSTTTNMQFGTPIPSAVGPVAVGSLGHNTNFIVTPGDKAIFSLLFATNGTIDDPASDPCPGDVDESQVVDKDDLMIVLEYFGQPVSCGAAADADGDGDVDGFDVSTVISFWGACPG